MTAVLDVTVAPAVPAGANAHPDDVAAGQAREARLDRRALNPAGDGRLFAAACAWDWHLSPAVVGDLVLVVDELVANAVRHAVWPAGRYVVLVRLALVGWHVTVEVRDPDPVPPRWPGQVVWDLAVIDGADGPEDEFLVHGRGLAMVRALSAGDLCAVREACGKVVRVSLPISDRP